MIQRKKRNSSKINLTISAVFHTALILAVFVFAAREGMLGKKLKELTVTMVPKEKKPEPPKPKPEEPKPELPKAATAPKAVVPPPPSVAIAPPPSPAAPSVAPAAAVLPSMDFSDGAHAVESISDPNSLYKALVEHSFRSRWNRPEDMADDSFAAEVELNIDKGGRVEVVRWVSGSGNSRWDETVKTAVGQLKTISRPPPKGFPEKFVVRFDVESQKTEPVLQLSSR